MNKFLRILTSVKISVVLIAYLIVTAVLATLVPQGLTPENYTAIYPALIGRIVLFTGFNHFFSSILFVLPSVLFFINLSACTINRLVRELRKTRNRRYGPILLHVGLMVLVVGSVISYSARRDGIVFLAEGEQVELPGNRVLSLLDFSFERYPDGRPKSWTSVINVTRDGSVETGNYSLQVNRPLRAGRIKLYQSSYGSERIVDILDPDGRKVSIRPGNMIRSAGENLQYLGFDQEKGKAVMQSGTGDDTRVIIAGVGDSAGVFLVTGIVTRDTSGIQAVEDVGFPYVLAGLLMAGAGIFLTFYRKLGELKP